MVREFDVFPIPDDSRGRWSLLADGLETRFDPASVHSVKSVCKATGVSRRELLEAVKRCRRGAEAPQDFPLSVDGTLLTGHSDPLAALDAAIAQGGEFIRWHDLTRLAAIDIDVSRPWDRQRLRRLAHVTGADRYWISRSGGGRLIFTNDLMVSAEERAAACIALLDLAGEWFVERVELLANTRTPPGEWHCDTSEHPHNTLLWLMAHVEGVEPSESDLEEAGEWLSDRGMTAGERHGHECCPIDPRATTGTDPVVALEKGIYCFLCANTTGDGFRSWGSLLHGRGSEPLPLLEAVREHVHWGHQRVVMQAGWPDSVQWRLAALAYRALLKATGAQDEEAAAVFDLNWSWLRGEGGVWLSPELKVEDVRGAHQVCSWTKGSPTRAKKLLNNSRLAGYVEVRPAPFMARPDCLPEGIMPIMSRKDIDPRREGLLPWDEAIRYAEGALPGLDAHYVKTLLVACVCAEAGEEVVGLLAVGPSGSGKTGIAAWVANLLGGHSPVLRLGVEMEDWRRQVGQALAAGHRPLLCNEVDKQVQFRRRHMAKLLDLQPPHTWRPLYGADIRTPWTAPLVLTGITPPDAFQSPELGRRFRLVRLPQKAGDWHNVGIHRWREESEERALVADSLIRWAMDYAESRGYAWQTCADDLGLPLANVGDPDQRALDNELMRRLFAHCCGLDKARTLSEATRYPAEHGWVDLTSKGAQALLEPLLEDVGGADPRYVLGKDLEAADWVTLLDRTHAGPLVFENRIHRAQWVGRFRRPGSRVYNEATLDGGN